jgi:hypothetical protein
MLEAIGVLFMIAAMSLAAWDANNGFTLRWGRLFVAAVVIGGIALVASTASAQHVHPDETITDPRVSSFYDSWKRPPGRVISCCHSKDCFAAQIRRGPNGLEYLHKWSGSWAALPSKILEHNQPDPIDSPNTENHVCANEMFPDIVYCAVLGGGT